MKEVSAYGGLFLNLKLISCSGAVDPLISGGDMFSIVVGLEYGVGPALVFLDRSGFLRAHEIADGRSQATGNSSVSDIQHRRRSFQLLDMDVLGPFLLILLLLVLEEFRFQHLLLSLFEEILDAPRISQDFPWTHVHLLTQGEHDAAACPIGDLYAQLASALGRGQLPLP